MASVKQENDNQDGSGSPATTLTVALTGVVKDNLIAVFCKQEGATDCTMVVTDGIGNTLTARTKQGNTTPNSWGQWHTYLAPSSGNFTYTVTFSPAASWPEIFAYEIPPANGTTWVYDTEKTANGTGTSLTSGNMTTTGSGIVLVGYAEITGATLSLHKVNSVAAGRVDGTTLSAVAWVRTHAAGFTGAATATMSAADAYAVCTVAYKERSLPALNYSLWPLLVAS